MQHFPLAIIGTGTFGAAAAYFLAPKMPVLLLDAHTPPHAFGAHHGETRLFRYLYQSHDYQILLNRAKALWADLEARHGVKLVERCGVLNLAHADSPMPENCEKMAQAYDLPYEMLSAAQVNARFAGWQVPPHYRAIFEPEAGYSLTDATLQLFLQQAREHGAVCAFNNPVLSIEPQAKRFVIETQHGRFVADKVIVSAGTWVHRIQGVDFGLDFEPVRKTFAWYQAPTIYHQNQGFTGFTAITETGIYYGFPDNGAGLKIGRHDSGEIMQHPSEQYNYAHYPTDQADTDHFAQRFMPALGQVLFGKTCSYDRAPNDDFIIKPHAEYEGMWLLSGFSGHGFKFAPAIGELAKRLVLGE